MQNILEMINRDGNAKQVTVSLFDTAGVLQSATVVTVPAFGQLDVDVSQLSGFTTNSYGLLKLEFSGTLDGRVSFYRVAGGQYQFAFNSPFRQALAGTTYASFNTFDPSTLAAQQPNTTLNWLSLLNLESQAKSFSVKRYDMSGALIDTTPVTVPAFGRVDLDGGHGLGASQVGLNQIVPLDDSAKYLALLTRYGTTATAGEYSFAFPIAARQPGAQTQWSTISRGGDATNWVEVVSTSAASQSVSLEFYDSNGNVVKTLQTTLAPFAQVHLNASESLPSGSSGAVKIASSIPNGFIANSMFYFFEASGAIDAMYGTASGPAKSGLLLGSYNLYLGMYDWLRLFNAGTESDTVTVLVLSSAGLHSEQYTLAPHTGLDLGLHEPLWQTSPDTYGLIGVSGNSVVTELLRIKYNSTGSIDIATATAVR
ncbi:MAG: hypothetical protein KDD44_04605 [Bdellovibrionales bacterium]|nr:hypothetical protein [Bdellovibrionales bacterium]